MKKYEMFRTRLISVGILATMGVLLMMPVLADPPPPPPPPPVSETVDNATKVMNAAKDLKMQYDMYNAALKAYLSMAGAPAEKLDAAALTNSNQALVNAAKRVGDTIGKIQRLTSSLSKEVQNQDSSSDVIQNMEARVKRSTLPPKTQEALMDELRKALQGRGGGSVAIPTELVAPAVPVAPTAPPAPAKPAVPAK